MPDIISAKNVLSQLKESKVFKDWVKNNPKAYLCHVFFLFGKKEQCQIGYYDSKKDLITSFDVDKNVTLGTTEKPFKPEGMEVKEVSMKDVSLDFKEAIAIVEDIQRTKYPSEKPVEIIVILQNLASHGTVFNVTHVTHSFKTLNVKVKADNGDILDEQLVSIIQFSGK
ncbi:MAG: hypothetical protein KKE20_02010 [Nanoarchaeota archaeon]|nr:hypothetical protein [Nanoarchaeota archaeon]